MRSVAFVLALLVGCGGHKPVPKRLVVEGDLGAWHYRRFQGPLLDVEVWIAGNKGEAYSASYITEQAEKTGHIEDKDLVNVTVTGYEKPDGVVRETVKLARRLAAEKGYQVDEEKISGVRALTIKGPSEAWVMWPSKQHVVKVGGQGRTSVPSSLVGDYGNRYPSKLPGGSLEGALPPGPEDKPKANPKEPYDPNNPHPDLDKYDPKKVKLPEKKEGPTQLPPPDAPPPADPKKKK